MASPATTVAGDHTLLDGTCSALTGAHASAVTSMGLEGEAPVAAATPSTKAASKVVPKGRGLKAASTAMDPGADAQPPSPPKQGSPSPAEDEALEEVKPPPKAKGKAKQGSPTPAEGGASPVAKAKGQTQQGSPALAGAKKGKDG